MHTETSGNRIRYSLTTGLRTGWSYSNPDNCKRTFSSSKRAGWLRVRAASYSMCNRALYIRFKRLGREYVRSSPSNAEAKNEWRSTSILSGLLWDLF